MNNEKTCPFLKEPCIQNRCALWIRDPISQKRDDNIIPSLEPMCSFLASGFSAIAVMRQLVIDLEYEKSGQAPECRNTP